MNKSQPATADKLKEIEDRHAETRGYWCCDMAMEKITTLTGPETDCSCCSLDEILYQCSKCKTIKTM